jgi:hypothetical protein
MALPSAIVEQLRLHNRRTALLYCFLSIDLMTITYFQHKNYSPQIDCVDAPIDDCENYSCLANPAAKCKKQPTSDGTIRCGCSQTSVEMLSFFYNLLFFPQIKTCIFFFWIDVIWHHRKHVFLQLVR